MGKRLAARHARRCYAERWRVVQPAGGMSAGRSDAQVHPRRQSAAALRIQELAGKKGNERCVISTRSPLPRLLLNPESRIPHFSLRFHSDSEPMRGS
jgi:hypothetical protein